MRRILSVLLLCLWFVGATAAFAQGTPEDDRIYDQVRLRLANNAEVKGAALEVIVKAGAVTLRGKVRTDKAKHKAEQLVHKVKGVKSVVNQLTVSPT